MILTLNGSSYNEDDNFYYSDPIIPNSSDSLFTIEAELVAYKEISLQQSIDGNTWYDCPNTTFTCSPIGMQSFAEWQPGLILRLKSYEELLWAKILI